MIAPINPNELEKTIHFPLAGLDVSMAFSKQPAREVQPGRYARTCSVASNVRGFDRTNTLRGGSRPGLRKYLPERPAGETWIVQHIGYVTGKRFSEADMGQFSQAGRVVTLIAVSRGVPYAANAGDTAWIEATNNTGVTPPLNISGVVFSAPSQQRLYFADGVNWCVYSPIVNTIDPWVATAGTLPVDSENNKPRLICTWRGRIVLSGLLLDPQLWFMSAVDNPNDFDYAPASPTPTQAVAGNNSPLGTIGDIITGLCPYTDDILVMFGDHSIYILRGDPMAGGQIDLVSNTIGAAWGEAFCMDPYGNIYFMSNRMGVYVMTPGQQPQRISQAIDQLLYDIDTGLHSIRLLWNDRYQGVHVFISPILEPELGVTHFFYEARTAAWWPDTFASKNFDPLACCTFDGNLPSDRVNLIGSWDGYVRALDGDVTEDDGLPIESEVIIGPLMTDNMDTLLVKDLQAVLSIQSSDVQYEILTGDTAEEALASEPAESGTWEAGFNVLSAIRRAGHACYIRISSSSPWSLEAIRVRLTGTGKVRRRGKISG